MVREKNNTTRFLTTSSAAHVPPEKERKEEEFDESDVVWSDYKNDENGNNVNTTVALPSVSYTAGISAALLGSNEPSSPTSVQRKTTSSPVSMISSSISRSPSGGAMVGSYYGRFHQSAPVNVPVWPSKLRNGPKSSGLGPFDDDDGEWLQDDGEMVPPHEILARSHNNTTTFSVFEGAGRTLKGRDLTRVRNAVFQKTGFLE